MEVDKYGLPNAVNSNGAVSPITRAIDKVIPDNIPAKPQGTTTFNITLWYGTPNESAASFNESGNNFKVCSVERITIGSIIIAKAILPDIAENVPSGFTIQK